MEEAAAIVGDGGDEESAFGRGSLRDGHTRRVYARVVGDARQVVAGEAR
jgi:hypothetical protein